MGARRGWVSGSRSARGLRPADSQALWEDLSTAGLGLGWNQGRDPVHKPIQEKPRGKTAERGDGDANTEPGDIQVLGLFTEVGHEHLE